MEDITGFSDQMGATPMLKALASIKAGAAKKIAPALVKKAAPAKITPAVIKKPLPAKIAPPAPAKMAPPLPAKASPFLVKKSAPAKIAPPAPAKNITLVPGKFPGKTIIPSSPIVKASNLEAVKAAIKKVQAQPRQTLPVLQQTTPAPAVQPRQTLPVLQQTTPAAPRPIARTKSAPALVKENRTQRSFAPVDLPFRPVDKDPKKVDKSTPYHLLIDPDMIVPSVDSGLKDFYGN